MQANSNECYTLDTTFRFDQPSEELQKIKKALMRGVAVQISEVSGINIDDIAKKEIFVLCFYDSYEAVMIHARGHYDAVLDVVKHQTTTKIGSRGLVAEKIHATLDKGLAVYLIPENSFGTNVYGNFTALFLTPRS